MYQEHFGFTAPPFSIAPDPHSLYMSERHKEALAHLFYGMRVDGGFVMLTGEVGTGKTTICRCLLEQVPENTDIAFIFNPKLTVEELLETICDEFGIQRQKDHNSIKFYVDHINSFLLESHAKGRKAVLIIDEAQNLSTDVLEQIRLLTNLETNERKLLQIILLGQPELTTLLKKPELRQLEQRITARYHLTPLSESEAGSYIAHRIEINGGRKKIFPESTIKTLFTLTNGTPRLLNIICDRALLGAYVQDQDMVDVATIKKAAREVFGQTDEGPAPTAKKAGMIIAGLVVLFSASVLAAAYFKKIPDTLFVPGQMARLVGMTRPEQDVALKETEPLPPPRREEAPQSEELKPVSQQRTVPDDGALAEEAHATASTTPQPPISQLKRPEGVPLDAGLLMAYQALLASWGISDVPADLASARAIAQSHNLDSITQQGSFNTLLELNRPAILSLYDNHGGRFYATFTSFDGQALELAIGAEHQRVSIGDFKTHWNGEYILLWEKPAEYSMAITPENHGARVEWLDKILALIQNRPPSVETPVLYDHDLVSQVKQFQFERNLIPDGIVGPFTIIHLNSAYNSKVPKLFVTDSENVRRTSVIDEDK